MCDSPNSSVVFTSSSSGLLAAAPVVNCTATGAVAVEHVVTDNNVVAVLVPVHAWHC